MSGQGKNIKFDFNATARQAQLDFPAETKNIEFIDLAEDAADEKLRQWIKSFGPRNEAPLLEEIIAKGSSFAFKDPISGHGVLVRNPADCACFFNDPEKGAHFNFNHELGHLIIPEAFAPDDADEETCRRTESIADSFAAVRGLQKGVLDKKDIETIAEKRAYYAWLHQAVKPDESNIYMTSYALDCVNENYNEKTLQSLTAEEIRTLARDHGQKYKTAPEYALKCLERSAKKEKAPSSTP